ncbi:hypothetical protein PQ610_04900 [Tardisphaera miroshnichenkoae]
MSAQQTASRSSLGNTRNGIILMMIGFVIGMVPGLSSFGGLLQIFGIILVIAGRRAIPGKHSRMVFISLIFLLLAVGVMVPADLRFSSAVSSGSALMANFSFAGLVAVLTPYLYSAAAAYPLYFGSFLTLIYFVVRGWQRKALWGFYGLTLLLLFYMLYKVMVSVMALYSSAVTYSSVGQLSAALSPLTSYPSLINFIWLIAYAMAYLSIRGMMKATAQQGGAIYNQYYSHPYQPPRPSPNSGQVLLQQTSPQQMSSLAGPSGNEGGPQAAKPTEAGGQPRSQETAQPPPSGNQGSAPSSGPGNQLQPTQAPERVLFYKSPLQFVRIDQRKAPLNPGTLVITDRGVYFLAKSRLAGASFLLAAPLAFATYKALTSADLSNLQAQLKSNGSFYVGRESLRAISAKPSGWLSAGEIVLSFSKLITPYGSALSGYAVTLQAMGKGGGVALSQDDVRALMAISASGVQLGTEASQQNGQQGFTTASSGVEAPPSATRRPLLQGNTQAKQPTQPLSAATGGAFAPAETRQPVIAANREAQVATGTSSENIEQGSETGQPTGQTEEQQASPEAAKAEEPAGTLQGERMIGIAPFLATFRMFEIRSVIFTDQRLILTTPGALKDMGLTVPSSKGVTAAWAAVPAAVALAGVGGLAVGGLAGMAEWKRVKKKAEESGIPVIIRIDVPLAEFKGHVIKGHLIDYSLVKKMEVKKDMRTLGSRDWNFMVDYQGKTERYWVNAKGAEDMRSFVEGVMSTYVTAGMRRSSLQGGVERHQLAPSEAPGSASMAPETGVSLPQGGGEGHVETLGPTQNLEQGAEATPQSEGAQGRSAAHERPADSRAGLPEERVIGVIPLAAASWTPYSLVFTDRRMIIANPKDISSIFSSSGAVTGAVSAAATLALGVLGFAAGNLLSGVASLKAWSDLKKKAKEQGLAPVYRLDQPFGGLKGKSVEYAGIKKATFKKASHFAMTSDMELHIYVEHRSFRNPDHAFLLDSEWAGQVEEFLRSTPIGAKLSA